MPAASGGWLGFVRVGRGHLGGLRSDQVRRAGWLGGVPGWRGVRLDAWSDAGRRQPIPSHETRRWTLAAAAPALVLVRGGWRRKRLGGLVAQLVRAHA